MITGVLLAVARISGETAPLLFTALNNQFWSLNLTNADGEPAGRHLPVRAQPLRGLAELAWTGALIITLACCA
jgi:phosphate transport system permease protein